MAERACDRDRFAVTTLAGRRCPDGELQISRHVPWPRLGKRDLDPPGVEVSRRLDWLEMPHFDDTTGGGNLQTLRAN
jgi:hypothetical protein